MLEAHPEIGEEGHVVSQHQMPLDAHPRIVLALGEGQDLLPHSCSLLEVTHVDVKAREPSENRKQLGDLSLSPTQVQGAGVRLLDLRRAALDRHERPGEADLQHDLLLGALRCRGSGGDDAQQIGGEADHGLVPPARIVE